MHYLCMIFICNLFQAFSIFTGLGIHNCQMYENACKLMAKQSVALEVLSYHATAQNDETEKLMVSMDSFIVSTIMNSGRFSRHAI